MIPNWTIGNETKLTIDGIDQSGAVIHLIDDHQQHSVEVKTQGVPVP